MIGLFRRLLGQTMLLIAPEGRFPGWNRYAMKILGASIGARAKIYSSVRLSRGLSLVVGAETFIGSNTTFTGGAGSKVTIGKKCDISDHVHFVTGTHVVDREGDRAAGKGFSKDIVVGNGVWIGYNALVLAGITIGDNAIIGAGTVVHKNVPPRTIVAGNPMSTIRRI